MTTRREGRLARLTRLTGVTLILGLLATAPAWTASADESIEIGDVVQVTLTDGTTFTGMLVSKMPDYYLIREAVGSEPRRVPYESVHMMMVDDTDDDEFVPDPTEPVYVNPEAAGDLGPFATILAVPTVEQLNARRGPRHFVIYDARTAERFPISASGEILITAPRQLLGRDYDSFVLYDDTGASYRNDEFWRIVRGDAWYEHENVLLQRYRAAGGVLLASGLSVLGAGLAVTLTSLITTVRAGGTDYSSTFAGMGLLAISVPLLGIRAPLVKEARAIESFWYDPEEVYQAAYDYAERNSGMRRGEM